MVLAAIVTAKLWLVLIEWRYFSAHPREIFTFGVVQSGGTFFGGILGAILLAAAYTWYEKMPILPLFDTYAAALPLGPRHRPPRLLHGRLLLRQAHLAAVGREILEPDRRAT